MVDYQFYKGLYGGDSVPEEDFAALARETQAQLNRYKRVYRVTLPTDDPNAEDMAMCAMVDALYFFRMAQNGQIGSSVSVGSVSSSQGKGAVPDVSPAAQSAELFRCANMYLEIYRGPGGALC